MKSTCSSQSDCRVPNNSSGPSSKYTDMRKLMLLCALALPALPLGAQTNTVPTVVPDAVEIKLGEVMAPKFAELQGMKSSPQVVDLEAILQRVGDKVAAHAKRKMPWKFHLDPDPRFKSAVALPGGQVFVGGGILTLIDREDELAIVLGHEIAHIDLMQVNGRIAEEMKKRNLTLEQLDQIPAEDWGANYGREKEVACDQEGMRLAVEAGYSPYGAVRILDVFRYFFSQDERHRPRNTYRQSSIGLMPLTN